MSEKDNSEVQMVDQRIFNVAYGTDGKLYMMVESSFVKKGSDNKIVTPPEWVEIETRADIPKKQNKSNLSDSGDDLG